MAEEHGCEAPEGHHLCANNCGFFGSPATMDLCSKCYRDFYLKEQQQASIKASLSGASSVFSPPSTVTEQHIPSSLILPEITGSVAVTVAEEVPATNLQHPTNRCASCKKRVGLTGFKCRCGITFCGTHRYPEKHNCSFDYKAVGKEEIARANPLVKGEKLDKI